MRQLTEEDKISIPTPFSYVKAITKDEVSYPIVPNCPVIDLGEERTEDGLRRAMESTPVNTLVVLTWWNEDTGEANLRFRVPDYVEQGPGLFYWSISIAEWSWGFNFN